MKLRQERNSDYEIFINDFYENQLNSLMEEVDNVIGGN